VLEIGCGLALASLVIHRRLGDITASDCHPLTEDFLVRNTRLNGLPTLKYQTGHWAKVNPDLGEFDLIIGSDVLYERDHPEQLSDFIEVHAAARAEVLIVDPNRGNRAAFSRCMGRRGYDLTEQRIDAPLDDGSSYHGRLLCYRREQRAPAAPL
jgi:predicted nicotinamide N-methyase